MDKDKALAWLNEKWPEEKRICEICGNNHYRLNDHIVDIVAKGQERSYPSILTICPDCGNTKYFNAVIAGLIKSDESEEIKEDKKVELNNSEEKMHKDNDKLCDKLYIIKINNVISEDFFDIQIAVNALQQQYPNKEIGGYLSRTMMHSTLRKWEEEDKKASKCWFKRIFRLS